MSYNKPPPSLEWAVSALNKIHVMNDECPRCMGSLDTGWECNKCGYDAYPIAEVLYSLDPLDHTQSELTEENKR